MSDLALLAPRLRPLFETVARYAKPVPRYQAFIEGQLTQDGFIGVHEHAVKHDRRDKALSSLISGHTAFDFTSIGGAVYALAEHHPEFRKAANDFDACEPGVAYAQQLWPSCKELPPTHPLVVIVGTVSLVHTDGGAHSDFWIIVQNTPEMLAELAAYDSLHDIPLVLKREAHNRLVQSAGGQFEDIWQDMLPLYEGSDLYRLTIDWERSNIRGLLYKASAITGLGVPNGLVYDTWVAYDASRCFAIAETQRLMAHVRRDEIRSHLTPGGA